MRILTLFALLAIVCVPPSAADPATAAETIFVNGNVHTLDAAGRRAEAIAVAGGRILRVGAAADVEPLRGPETRVVDLGGGTVVPGLIDAHGHLASLGALAAGRLDLSDAKSFADVVAQVKEKAAGTPRGEWILGRQWDQADWGQAALPAHDELSAAVPDHPVWLWRVDGHAALANRAAMALARITRDTPNPPGGEVLRDAAGEPTGVFVDNALDLVEAAIPAERRGAWRELLLAGQERCLAAGLTGVHDAGMPPAGIEALQALAAEGRLELRVYAMVSGDDAGLAYAKAHPPRIGDAGGRLTVRCLKLAIDGAMGSRGAWLLAPYSDRPAGSDGKPYTGLPVTEPARIEAAAALALERGWQVATHAIGDRGVRETLDAYERALAKAGRPKDRRFRIEHFQCADLADLPRLAALGVIASMQPTHATSDMRWAEQRVGAERIRGCYAWATTLRSGATLAFGSDFPVESENPLWGLHAAVTRQDGEGRPEGGWRFAEALGREEALRAFTLGAATAAFEEADKGTLEAGKLADFAVLDRDLMTCPPGEIRSARCLRTVIGGKTVFERK